MRYSEIKKLLETQELDEVKMSPSALAKFASSAEAEGIQAGFEAELIFRDTESDSDDSDMEADMDYDERTSSIDDVINFFSNDDYGYGLSDREADRLRDKIDNAYFEWYDDRVYASFRDEADDLVREVWLDERPMVERIHDALVDGMGLSDDAADAVMKLANDRTKGKADNLDPEQKELLNQYYEAEEIAQSVLDEDVESSLNRQDDQYDRALENYRDNYDVGDDSGFWTDMGWRWMSDIMNEFNLDWPYYSGGGNGGSRGRDDIARSLEKVTGYQVKSSYGYHSTKRGDWYIIEPDSSLDADDREDVGLEVVSPPMPLNKAIEQLEAVIDWANSEGDAYTNSSTGLHMGISIPHKGGDVDYLKLILFLGDQYVLEKFGRSANHFCDSALKKLKQNVAGSKNRGDDKIASAMDLMKHSLIELAHKYVQQGVGNSKYTSAHIKPGYIEFRSPGGDYLSHVNRDIGALADTMRRFAYAMYLAGRPDLERPEYYKKLYKLISPEGNKEFEMFAKFSAGEITLEQLKKEWAEKVIAKEVPVTGNEKGQWILYDNETQKPVPGMSFGNYTEIDAWERAKAKISPGSSMEGFKKAYTLANDYANTGRWDVVEVGTHKVIDVIDAKARGQAADEAYDRQYEEDWYVRPHVDFGLETDPEPKLSRRAQLAKQIAQPKDYVIINKHSGLPFYTFRASSQSQAVDFSVSYLRDKGLDVGNFTVQKAVNAKQAVDNARDSKDLERRLEPANYEFVYEPTGRVLDRIDGINRMQADAILNDVRRRYNDLQPADIFMRRVQPSARDLPDAAPEANQVRMPNGVPVWELVDVGTNHSVHVIADHTLREAWNQALSWLRSIGAEDPSTYRERFNVRPKQLQPGERNNPPPQHSQHNDPDDATPRYNWELYQHDRPEEVFHRMDNATREQVMDYIEHQEANGMPAGFLHVRHVNESRNHSLINILKLAGLK